jgi:HSP20 family protein
MSDRLNRMFEPGAALEKREEQALNAFDWAPSVNISETDKGYLVKAELPEVKKEDIRVTHDNGLLTIEGERRYEKREDKEKMHRIESSYGRFFRSFRMPEDADLDRIEAVHKDGMLSVTIPKAEKAATKRQIRVS